MKSESHFVPVAHQFTWGEAAVLLEEMKKAEQEAPSLQEIDELDHQDAQLLNDFIDGRISLIEYHTATGDETKTRLGEIHLLTVQALAYALQQLKCDEREIDELIEHEVEHLNEAHVLGLTDSVFMIRFSRNEDSTISFRAASKFILPKEGDEDLLREHLRRIIEAPQDMSDLDLKQTGKL